MKAQMSVKREMSNARSPVLGHLGAAMSGLGNSVPSNEGISDHSQYLFGRTAHKSPSKKSQSSTSIIIPELLGLFII